MFDFDSWAGDILFTLRIIKFNTCFAAVLEVMIDDAGIQQVISTLWKKFLLVFHRTTFEMYREAKTRNQSISGHKKRDTKKQKLSQSRPNGPCEAFFVFHYFVLYKPRKQGEKKGKRTRERERERTKSRFSTVLVHANMCGALPLKQNENVSAILGSLLSSTPCAYHGSWCVCSIIDRTNPKLINRNIELWAILRIPKSRDFSSLSLSP